MKTRQRIRSVVAVFAIAAGAATMSVSSIARAAEPTAAEKESAQKLVSDGDRLASERDFTGALRAYKSAAAITNTPPIALQVARTHEALGQFIEAREAYDRVARMPSQPGDPPAHDTARTEAEGLSARVVDRIPTLVVSVSGRPSGSLPTVTVDGNEVASASSALPRRLNPGKHIVRVTLAGYLPVTAEVELREGENRAFDVPLVVDPNAVQGAAQPAATPAIVTSPGAASSDNYDRSMTFFHVGLAVGGTGLVVGTVFGIISLGRASSAKENCNSDDRCTPAAQSDIDTSTTLAHVSNVGFGVALVGAGLAIYGLVTRPARTRAALVHPSLTPLFGPGSAGLGGRF